MDREIERRAVDIVTLARDILFFNNQMPPPPAPEPQLPADPGPPGEGYLGVGKADCAPGGTCEVEIWGHSLRPVSGFGLGIGRHADVDLAEWTVDWELIDRLGFQPFAYVDVGEASPGYNVGNYFHVHVGFFPQLAVVDVPKGSTDPATRKVVEVALPPMTKLMRLKLKVPAHFAPGLVLELLNRDNHFGRSLLSPPPSIKRLRIRNQFTTQISVEQFGIYPELVSGFIQVK